jgi:hypothetical protein
VYSGLRIYSSAKSFFGIPLDWASDSPTGPTRPFSWQSDRGFLPPFSASSYSACRTASNESVTEFLRGCDHIGLFVDEPYGPAGLLFIDSFVGFRSVFLNGDESQPRPAALRLWWCRAGEGTRRRVTLRSRRSLVRLLILRDEVSAAHSVWTG